MYSKYFASTRSGCKQVYGKIHLYTFCSAQLSSNIHRHQTNVHIDEEAIREILVLPKSSFEWKVKLQKLNKCHFKHNSIVTREGGGDIVVRKRCTANVHLTIQLVSFVKENSVKTDLWRLTVLHGTQRIF